MTDTDLPLPTATVWTAGGLVAAVHDRDARMVAHWLRLAADGDGLEALAVTLAAMCDDEKTPRELLAWAEPGRTDVAAWRNALTDRECAAFHRAFNRGERDPEVVDGEREHQKRRARRKRRQDAQGRTEEVAA